MVRCFFEKNDEKNNCQKYLDIQGSTFVPERKTRRSDLKNRGPTTMMMSYDFLICFT